jgi:hypothetical protein
MSLVYEGTILRNTKKISEINIVTGTHLKIKQQKLTITEISCIIADAHRIDPLTE